MASPGVCVPINCSVGRELLDDGMSEAEIIRNCDPSQCSGIASTVIGAEVEINRSRFVEALGEGMSYPDARRAGQHRHRMIHAGAEIRAIRDSRRGGMNNA